MPVATLDSNEARAQWRSILDAAGAGEKDIVITHYGKPVAALIDYADWLAIQETLDDLRATRRADAAFTVPAHRPIRSIYIKKFVRLVLEGRGD